MKRFLVALAGIISLLYLLNPTMGLFELLPDNIPFIGNIDEATATMVLLGAMRYFGWDVTNLFMKKTAIDFGKREQ